MRIFCTGCSSALSLELQPVSMADRNDEMGEDFLQRGRVIVEDGTYFQGKAGSPIVHTEDVLHVHLTDDWKRLNGCCGLAGCYGPNLLCDTCNVYVATKMTDCWTSHCVVFEAGSVKSDSIELLP